jgi:hypothetical protein
LFDSTQFFLEVDIERSSRHLFLKEGGAPSTIGGVTIGNTHERSLVILEVFEPLVNSFGCVEGNK